MDGVQRNILETVDVNSAVVQHSQGDIERLNPCVLRSIEGGTLHFIAVPRSTDEEYIDHTLLNPEFLTASIQNGIVVDIVQTQQQPDGGNGGGSNGDGSLLTNSSSPHTYHATNNNISGQMILQSHHHQTNQNHRSQFVQEIDTNNHATVINSGSNNNKNHQSAGIIIQSAAGNNNNNSGGIVTKINESSNQQQQQNQQDRRLFVQYVQKSSGSGLQHHQNAQQILHTTNEAQVIVSNTINTIQHQQHQLQQDVPPLAPISRTKQGRLFRTVPIIRPPQHQQSDQLVLPTQQQQQQPVISSVVKQSTTPMSIVKLKTDVGDSDDINFVKKRLRKRLSAKEANLPHKKRITTACSDGGGGGNSNNNAATLPLPIFKRGTGVATQHDLPQPQQIIQKPQKLSNRKKQQINSINTQTAQQNQSLQIFEFRHTVDSNQQILKNQFHQNDQQQQLQQHQNDDDHHQTQHVTYEIRNIEEFIGNPQFHHEIIEQTNLSSSEQQPQSSQTLLTVTTDSKNDESQLQIINAAEQHRISHQYACEICGKIAENQFKFFTHLKYHYEPSLIIDEDQQQQQQTAITPPPQPLASQDLSILKTKNINHELVAEMTTRRTPQTITPPIAKTEPSFSKSSNEILYFNTSNLTTMTTTSGVHNENNRITIELPVISHQQQQQQQQHHQQQDHQLHQNQHHFLKNNDDSNGDGGGIIDGGVCGVDNNNDNNYDDCSNSIINDNANNISNLRHEQNGCNKINHYVKSENSIVITESVETAPTISATSTDTTIIQHNEFSDTEDMLEGIRSAVDKVQQSVENDWNENDAAAADAAAAAATAASAATIDESEQHTKQQSSSNNIWFDTDNSNIPIIYRLPDDDHPRLATTTNKLHINSILRDQLLKREEETIINDDGSTTTTHFIVDGQLIRQNELISTGDGTENCPTVQNIINDQQQQQQQPDQQINNLVFHEVQTTKPSSSEVTKSINTNAAPEKPKRKKKLYDCKYCEKVCNSKNSLRYHMLSHTGERPHQCDQCGKGFFSSSALKVHKRLHTGIKPYSCEICNRAFRQWGDLKYHITSLHTEEKNHQCEFCGKDFARRYSLVVHRRIHTGEKNYKCEYCDKTFRASSYLQDHRKIHTGEKPHICEHCGKKFRVRGDLKRHWNIHTRPWAAKKIKEPGMGGSVGNITNIDGSGESGVIVGGGTTTINSSRSSDEAIMINNDQDTILNTSANNINSIETNNSFDGQQQNSTVDLTDIYLYESTNNKDQHDGSNTQEEIKQYIGLSHQNKMLTATVTNAQVAVLATQTTTTTPLATKTTKTTSSRKSKTVKTNAGKRFKGTTPILLTMNKELTNLTTPQ